MYPRPMVVITSTSALQKRYATTYFPAKAKHPAGDRAWLVAHFPGFHSQYHTSWVWWHKIVILAVWKKKQESKDTPGYHVQSMST